MANDDGNGRIGCEAGRTKIIDPNDFNGFNSSSNMSVPLEDLNISVILKTQRKGRTVLTNDEDKKVTTSNSVAINFIQGSDFDGKKVLTTKYTDLTTILDKNVQNSETLGITNIDIDFNSSYAPMVTINFIDVRGSSIFQNEEQIVDENSSNKYSAFFQIPYPIFELEIKGYYGKPVTYCLHMLKFNSKFNSQTGNFEIQCEFIGYTYAMLSDLLIGYLKVIKFTQKGKDRYDAYNLGRNKSVLNLFDLVDKINHINDNLKKVTSTSSNAVTIDNATEGEQILKDIEGSIKSLASVFTSNFTPTKSETLDRYPYIISEDVAITDSQREARKTFHESLTNSIQKFNELNIGATINDLIPIPEFENLTLDELDSKNTENDEETSDKLNNPTNLKTLKAEIFDFITKNYDIAHDKSLDIDVLTSLYKDIDNARFVIGKNHDAARKSLALEVKNTISESLGVDPTVRNMIEIYTAASEVFLESIYAVSSEAEASEPRRKQLEKVFSDRKTNDLKQDTFYAWPDYKENDGFGVYTQKYLGSDGVLENKTDVDEIVFIEDLYKAFITAAQQEQNAEDKLNQETKLWFPSSPLDTKLFNSLEPYSRVEFGNYQDVARFCVIRAMTFLAYTNDNTSLTEKEVMGMAKAEAQALLRGVTNDKIKQALSEFSKADNLNIFTNSSGVINSKESKVVLLTNDKKGYKYNYIYDSTQTTTKIKLTPTTTPFVPQTNTFVPDTTLTFDITNERRIIPINQNFTGDWSSNKKDLKKLRDNENVIFLTNYSEIYGSTEKNRFLKEDDGGIYVKIYSLDDYKTSIGVSELNEVPDGATTDSLFIYDKLKAIDVDNTAGYNVFGGPFGIQDYNTVQIDTNQGGDVNKKMPIKLLFYSSNFNDQPTGLAYNRKVSKAPDVSIYDFKSPDNIITVPKDKRKFYGPEGHEFHKNIGMNRYFLNTDLSGVTYPYIEQPAFRTAGLRGYGPGLREPYDFRGFSLFGSKFYYSQTSEEAKAFLFLNNLPFNKGDDASPFGKSEIKHLFDKRGGFVHAPKLWCAYVGSILWRLTFTDINDPIVWSQKGDEDVHHPRTVEYLTWGGYQRVFASYSVITIGHVISRLPQQAKDEFKQSFFNFVDGSGNTDWVNIKSKLEIWNGTSVQFNTYVKNLCAKVDKDENSVNLTPNDFKNSNLINDDKYSIISPVNEFTGSGIDANNNKYLFLELAGDYSNNEAVKTLIDSMLDEVVILNTGYKIWENTVNDDGDLIDGKENTEIIASTKTFELYFNTLKTTIKDSGVGLGEAEQIKQINSNIFGTSDENLVKLMLYKHCKNIHDKWLAGILTNDKIISRCGANRSVVDTELAKKYNNNQSTNPKLIDSFRFVSRSFEDIGDELLINPLPINDYLTENQNASIYDSISSLLNANKFEFIALPTYINFRDPEELKAIFKPYGNYGETINNSSCGPTFVCVYAGEKSKHLAISDADYPNDSFDLRCINGNLSPEVPKDFSASGKTWEDPLGVFTVKYSQQNQNIFKDISLDQSEFTETEESLKIMDDISQKGAETNRSFAGQNLYNVYSVRSYTAQIEMMGNSMIQPMMYFQLDNIPMFHGAYMITRVKHTIKPNYMSTNFTGVRIKYSKTKLLDAFDIFMPLIDSLDLSNSTGTGGGLSMNYVDRYYDDLLANIPKDKNIIGSDNPAKSTLTKAGDLEFSNWDNGKLDEDTKRGQDLLDKYYQKVFHRNVNGKEPWSSAFVSYMMLQMDANFPTANQHFDYVTSAMHGTNGYEVFPLDAGLSIKAEVGDIFCRKRSDTNYTASHCDVLYKVEGNSGFLIGGNRSIKGESVTDGATVNVTTIKFENGLVGKDIKTYKLLVKKTNNKYYNKKKLIDTGKHTDIVNIETGSNADYWALIAICSLEATADDGRCDVAQTIYNRLISKIYGKSSIKELIISPSQYTPVSHAINEFSAIKDKDTAITAHLKVKLFNGAKISRDDAKRAIELTEQVLKNDKLIKNSQDFIGGRTDFNAGSLDPRNVPSNVSKFSGYDRGLVSRNKQLFGWYVSPVAINYGKTAKIGNRPSFEDVTNATNSV